MRRILLAAVVLAAASCLGCASSGLFAAGNVTAVELAEPNYRIVATGVSGQARAAYLVGVSFSNGPTTQSLSLYRLRGSGQMYKEAMDGLWAAFEEAHGPVQGRRLALANVRYDADARNFLVYSDITLSIRADVIEFTDEM